MEVNNRLLTVRDKDFYVVEKIRNGILHVFVNEYEVPYLKVPHKKYEDSYTDKQLIHQLHRRWELVNVGRGRKTILQYSDGTFLIPLQDAEEYRFHGPNAYDELTGKKIPCLTRVWTQGVKLFHFNFTGRDSLCQVDSYSVTNKSRLVGGLV